MCTAACFKDKDCYFGRNLDYEFSYGEQIVVTPRNFEYGFRHSKEPDNKYALIGMAHVSDGYPLYYDAMNEKGLAIAGLNFVGNCQYNEKIEGKDVLIIEDIIDTGRSMNYITKHLQEKAPRALKICSLLSKPSRREEEVNIDYLGFEVPNKFIVGYGFDDEEGFNRNLPYIGYKD